MKKIGMGYRAGLFAAAWALSAGAWAVTDEALEMKANAKENPPAAAPAEQKAHAGVRYHTVVQDDGFQMGTETVVPGAGNDQPAIDPAAPSTPIERYRPVVQAADELAALAAKNGNGPESEAVGEILHKRLEPALKFAATNAGFEGGKALRGYQVVEEAAKFDCELRQRNAGGSAMMQDLQEPVTYYESECVASYAQRLRLSTPPSVRAALKAEAEAH